MFIFCSTVRFTITSSCIVFCYLRHQNLFDFIILDEASQLRLEDTYSSLLRGKTKIISGDKHQMPPSNFFGNETIFWNEEEESAEDFLAESKSLLEYAGDANYKSSYLDYHYRSLHPNLIQFSNKNSSKPSSFRSRNRT